MGPDSYFERTGGTGTDDNPYTYQKVWLPKDRAVSTYYEQVSNEGAIFTNVGEETLTVEKRWIGVANDNVSVRVIRYESDTPLAEGQKWTEVGTGERGWNKITDDSDEASDWKFVPGQIYTFARGYAGDQLLHTFSELPARDHDTGKYYIYGVYEVGGSGADSDYVAAYDVSTTTEPEYVNVISPISSDLDKYYEYKEATGAYVKTTDTAIATNKTYYIVAPAGRTIISNTSKYDASGAVRLTAAKDLEGKDQKGRSWNENDKYAVRLIPVSIVGNGVLTLNQNPTAEEQALLDKQPMPQPTATYSGVAYPVWKMDDGTFVIPVTSGEDDSMTTYYKVNYVDDKYVATDTVVTVADPATLTRAVVSWAYITVNSGYVTPTERSTTFDSMTFTVQDLIDAGGSYDNNNNLYTDFYYVMRELIPDGATAYNWKYEAVAGATGEYMRVATTEAVGVNPYKYEGAGATSTAERGLYVWEKDGVFYDTSMDLVQIHVADSRSGQLTPTVTHHKMNQTEEVDTQTHPTAAEIETAETAAVTFASGSTRTQPVFDNYYESWGVAAINVDKYLATRDWTNDDAYQFTIRPATGNEGRPMPVDSESNFVKATSYDSTANYYEVASSSTEYVHPTSFDWTGLTTYYTYDAETDTYVVFDTSGQGWYSVFINPSAYYVRSTEHTYVKTSDTVTADNYSDYYVAATKVVSNSTAGTATLTLTKGSGSANETAYESNQSIKHGVFEIPIELSDLTRATTGSAATATFVYRIDEIIPDNAVATINGQEVRYADRGSYGEAYIQAAQWVYTDEDGNKLIYTAQPVYAQVTATDNGDGTIQTSVGYFWAENCAEGSRLHPGQWSVNASNETAGYSQAAYFLNRTVTTLKVTKVWKDFDFAVQDSTFVVDGTDGTMRTPTPEVYNSEMNRLLEYDWPIDNVDEHTFTAGLTGSDLVWTFENLPAYTENGDPITYRAVEYDVNEGIDVSYEFSQQLVPGTSYYTYEQVVTNTFETDTVVNLAMVKELDGRPWLASDSFDFVIEPYQFSTYNNSSTSQDYGQEQKHNASDWTTYHAGTTFPVPEATTYAYALTSDTAVDTTKTYYTLSGDGTYTAVETAVTEGLPNYYERSASTSADAIATADMTQSKLGNYQYLAPFEPLTIDIHDLTLNLRTGFMTGDFYYKLHEVITIDDARYTKAQLDAANPLPEGVTKVDGKYVYDGVTYDLSDHDAHIHVQCNSVGELITTVTYDENNGVGSFTPVVVNTYDVNAVRTPNVSKLLLTRSGGAAWGTGQGEYNEFYFVQRPISGAPFTLADNTGVATGSAIHDDASAINAIRTSSNELASTGDAIYGRITAASDNDTARYIPTQDISPQPGTTYYVIGETNNYEPAGDISEFADGTVYYVPTTGGRAKMHSLAPILFTIDDLNRTVGGTGAGDAPSGQLKYSDGNVVPDGHKFGIFEYSFNEVVPSSGAYDTLQYDSSTQYSRIVVIDRGDGKLDLLTQFADGRMGDGITPNDGVTIYAQTTSASDEVGITGKAQFTNSEVMQVDVTKDWNGTQASQPVTFQLYRTSNKAMVADAAAQRSTMMITPQDDEAEGWAAIEGATVTIPAGAYGSDLTDSFAPMPLYDEDGSRYIYRVVEVGVRQYGNQYFFMDEDGVTPLYELLEYGFNPDTSGEGRHFTVKNSSEYASDGAARVNVVKELEGRGWIDSDEFTYLLTPVSKSGFARAESFEEGATYYVKVGDSYSVAKPQPTAETFGGSAYFKRADLTAGIPMPTVTKGEGDAAVTTVVDTASAVKGDGTAATGYISTTQRQAAFELIQFDNDDLVQIDGVWQGDFFYKIAERIRVGNDSYTVAQLAAMDQDNLPEGVTPATFGTNGSSKQSYSYKGVTYDPTVHDVRIHVEDDGAGNIIANVYYDNANTATAVPVYVNTYTATGETSISVGKELQGFAWTNAKWGQEDGFTFEIAPVGDVPVSARADEQTSIETVSITSTDEDHKVSSGVITFNLDDLPRNNNKRTTSTTGGAAGSFVYAISEVAPDAATQQVRKLQYDGSTVYAKIVMEDNLSGTLIPSVKYYEDAACAKEIKVGGVSATEATFTNSAYEDITTEKIWVGEATRGANIRMIRTTAPMLAEAGIIQDSTATLNQARWMDYFDDDDYPYEEGEQLINTSSAPKGWEFVAGTPYTFPQNPNVTNEQGVVERTGWIHTYENLPTRDEDGNVYVYGIWEGGQITLGSDEIASVTYDYKNETDTEPAHITVKNVSNYSAHGSIVLTVGKDLEGKDLKGRNWTDDDSFNMRLIPVAPTVEYNPVDNPRVEDIAEYYERSGDGTEASPYEYTITPDTTIDTGKTYYTATVTVDTDTQLLPINAQPMPTDASGVTDHTEITNHSTYVTPTERQGEFAPISFTIADLKQKGTRNSANRLATEYWYVMRELIPDGAVAYEWEEADGIRVAKGDPVKVDGKTLEYHFSDGTDYTATTDQVREQYVWEKDGVYYDTSMDLVHVHVTDGGASNLIVTVDHHSMENVEGSVITYSSSAKRTQPVFDNYYDSDGKAAATVAKRIDGRSWTADDVFEITITPATGRTNVPMPVADSEHGIAVTEDATTHVKTATITLKGVTGSTDDVTTSFDIPIVLNDLSRATVTSKATGTFVYRIEETVPANTRDLAYDTLVRYLRVTATDNQKGDITTTSEYFWDEACTQPIYKSYPRGMTEGATGDLLGQATFFNTPLSKLELSKTWTTTVNGQAQEFDYAVQDTTFVLERTSVNMDTEFGTDVDPDELNAFISSLTGWQSVDVDADQWTFPDMTEQQVTSYVTINGSNVTFKAGTPKDALNLVVEKLPAYATSNAASGNRMIYRLRETAPNADDSDNLTTTYIYGVGEVREGDPGIYAPGLKFLTEAVTNDFTATTKVQPATVKELQGRPWVAPDEFTFTIEAAKVATGYDDNGANLSTDPDVLANVPLPAASTYRDGNGDEQAQPAATAHATMGTEAIGGYEHLATFGEISYDLTNLHLNPRTGFMTGDFYYKLHEVITVDGTAYTKADLDELGTSLPEGVTKVDGKYVYDGVTYDLASHDVHIHVQCNRLGELTTTMAYDETTEGDTSTGSRYTPVIVNTYNAARSEQAPVAKTIVGREFENGETFDFLLRPVNGAPYRAGTNYDGSASNVDISKSTETEALAALDEHPTTNYSTGDALYARLTVDTSKPAQTMLFQGMEIRLSDLNLKVGTDCASGSLKYSDGAYGEGDKVVPDNTSYGVFVYSVSEVASSATDLTIDPDTEYIIITAIDKLDGTLDAIIKFAGDRNGDNVHEGVHAATFTNVANEPVNVRKIWDGYAISPVTVQLLRTTKAVTDADIASTTVTIGTDPSAGWVTVPGATHTFSAGAYNGDLDFTFEDMPSYDSEGNAYTYRLVEEVPTGESAYEVKSYGTVTEGESDEAVTYLTVENESKYTSNGNVVVSAVKSLEGRDWIKAPYEYVDPTTGETITVPADSFTFKLAPTAKATEYNADGSVKSWTEDAYKHVVPTEIEDGVTYCTKNADGTYTAVNNPVANESYFIKVPVRTATATAGNNIDPHTMLRTANFDVVAFDQEDLVQVGGTWMADYYYDMSEVVPQGATSNGDGTYTYKGVTYDNTVHKVRMHLEDNGSGVIVAKVFYDLPQEMGDDAITELGVYTVPSTFYNTYDASGLGYLHVLKHIEGRNWQDGDKFRYFVRQVGGAIMNPDATADYTPLGNLDQGMILNADTWLSASVYVDGETKSPVVNAAGDRATITGSGYYLLNQLTYDSDPNSPTYGKHVGQFVYEITEVRVDSLTRQTEDGTESLDWYIDPALQYDAKTVYARIVVVDNGDGTLDVVNNRHYYSSASCSESDRIDTPIWVDADGKPVNYADGMDTAGLHQAWAPTYANAYETVDVTGTKTWLDGTTDHNNATELVLTLKRSVAGGEEETVTGYTPVWYGNTYTFENLPKKDANGAEYTYTVDEAFAEGFDSEGYTTIYSSDHLSFTNMHVKDVVATKVWNDNDNEDGKRPNSIELTLMANGEPTRHVETVSADTAAVSDGGNTWTYTFTGVPIYDANGDTIEYAVKETPVEGYETTYSDDGLAVTNTVLVSPTPNGVKTWKDNDDKNLRPNSITVKLQKQVGTNWVDVDEQVVTPDAQGEWKYTFTDQPKFDLEGNEIAYRVVEVPVSGYTTSYDATHMNVTNTLSDTTEFTVTKTWVGGPEEHPTIEVTLLANGSAVTTDADGEAITNPASLPNGTTENTWENLPVFDDAGKQIEYTVSEVAVEGYETTVEYNGSSATITNAFVTEERDITIIKTWVDDNNRDGLRPDTLTLELWRNTGNNDDAKVDEVTLTGPTNNEVAWTHTFTDMPTTNEQGRTYTYHVVEPAANVPQGYTANQVSDLQVANTREASTLTIAAAKVWNDENDKAGIRPESVTMHLLANGEDTGDKVVLDADNSWTATFRGTPSAIEGTYTGTYPVKSNGQTIVYSVAEDEVAKYTASAPVKSVDDNGNATFTITNSYSPETVTLSGEKLWVDNDDELGVRPESLTISLLADGVPYKVNGVAVTTTTQTTSDPNIWSYEFTNLPRYIDGNEVVWSVAEVQVPGYETNEVKAGYDEYGNLMVAGFVNVIQTTSVDVTKVWDDNDNASGMRPTSLTITARATGEGVTDIADRTFDITGATSTWTGSLANLPTYDKGGHEITWTVLEEAVPTGYTMTQDGTTITNTLGTSSLTVTKAWSGGSSNKPAVTMHLYSKVGEGEWSLVNGKDVVIPANATGDDLKAVWTGLPTTDQSTGKTIAYAAVEEPVEGYEVSYATEDGRAYDGETVTNTSTEVTVYKGQKVWLGDSADVRPESIEVTLSGSDGSTYTESFEGTGDTWVFEFANLPKYDDEGAEIVYTADEVAVPAGYDKTRLLEGKVIINKYNPDGVTVAKTWLDGGNRDGLRPDTLTLELHRRVGTAVDEDFVQNVELTGPTNTNTTWTKTVTGLPETDAQGRAYTYYVVEASVPAGYTQSPGDNELTIINTHEPAKLDLEVKKVWNDNNDEAGLRPENVTVHLVANGKDAGDEVTLSEGNGWSDGFDGLFARENGKDVLYTVVEDDVNQYATTYAYETNVETGNITATVTNTHSPETVIVSGDKLWLGDVAAETRPDSVTIALLANGEPYKVNGEPVEQTVSGEGDLWHYEFAGLPRYIDGSEPVYTVDELEVPGYTTKSIKAGYDTYGNLKVAGFVNVPAYTEIDVTKSWVDGNNQDGKRPENLTFTAQAGGEDVTGIADRTITVTGAKNTWYGSFTDLPTYDASGHAVTWTVTEANVDGYRASGPTGSAESGYVFTNTRSTGSVQLTATKVLQNADLAKYADQFTFTLTDENGETVSTAKPAADGSVTFAEIEYSSDDFEGVESGADGTLRTTKTYTVTESGDVAGIENDAEATTGKTITVTLVDNGDGTITATPSAAPTFTNVYEADGTLALTSTKQITNVGALSDAELSDGQFSFTLAAVEADAPKPDSTTATNDENGNVSFGPIAFTQAHAGKTFHYTVSEVAGTAEGWTYDTVVRNVAVTVVDDGDGTLSFDVNGQVYTDAASVTASLATFDNTFKMPEVGVNVTKTWNDANDQDGIRPSIAEYSELLTLSANDDELDIAPTVVATDANTYVASWSGLPKFDEHGETIDYTVDEEDFNPPAGYGEGYTASIGDPVVDANGNTTVAITNTHEPATVKLSGTKTWVDNDDQDGKRPESITITLNADGKAVAGAQKTVEEADDGSWTYEFTELPKYRDGGKVIEYSVVEASIGDYITEYADEVVAENGDVTANVTNTYEPGMTTITAVKVWDDANNQDGVRPANVTFTLTGTVEGDQVYQQSETANEGNYWTVTWNVSTMNQGKQVAYDVSETATEALDAAGYNTGEGQPAIVEEDGVWSVTNTYVPETVDVTATKIWVDDNDRDGLRGDVTFQLMATVDGVTEPVAGKTVTLTSADAADSDETGNTWSGAIEDLPAKRDGKTVTYTFTEISSPAGYSASVGEDGRTITNTHEPVTTSLLVNKVWDDSDNQEGLRGPVTVTLQRDVDGTWTDVDQGTLPGDLSTKQSLLFENLFVNEADGEPYAYRVVESGANAGYEVTYSFDSQTGIELSENEIGNVTITNTHEVGTTAVAATKVWADSDDADGMRADAHLRLIGTTAESGLRIDFGEQIASAASATASGDGTASAEASWANVPTHHDGEALTFEVVEQAMPGYETQAIPAPTYDEDESAWIVTVTNVREVAVDSITATKVWDDADNQDGFRTAAVLGLQK